MKKIIILISLFISAVLPLAKGQSTNYQFPKNFNWCVATSAHQIEGNNIHSDWWRWEQSGKVANKENTNHAADHWNRVEADVDLITKVNANTYRFSVEWAKIEPKEGEWDSPALDHYKNEIKILRSKGIEPLITLQHFTLPSWVAEKGGWEWDQIPVFFERYTAKVYEMLNGNGAVHKWITINEPTVFLAAGYLAGTFPPGKIVDLAKLKTPMVNILKAHGRSYQIIKKLAQEKKHAVQVSIVHSLRAFDPKNWWNPLDHIITYYIEQIFNWSMTTAAVTGELKMKIPFLINIDETIPDAKDSSDFIGFNYYNHDLVKFSLNFPFHSFEPTPGAPVSDLGWEIYPKGIYKLVKEIHSRFPSHPIYITENGIADANDSKRKDFIEDHLIWLHRAISEGANVTGYCHWSLMDNFEWDKGYSPRFGLYEVVYSTQARNLRASAEWFSSVTRQNRFSSTKKLK